MQHWIFRIFECPSNFFAPPLFRSIAQISRLLINNRNVSIKLLSPRDGQLFMLGHRQPCFFRANWPKASERVKQSTMIHAYLAAFDLSSLFLSLSSFISSYRRVCISFTASFLLARFLFPSLDVELSPLPLVPLPLPTFFLLFPPPSLPRLLLLLLFPPLPSSTSWTSSCVISNTRKAGVRAKWTIVLDAPTILR